MTKPTIPELRRAVANYIQSEGCSCCENYDQHHEDKAVLGKMLKVPQFSDKSGYDFCAFMNRGK